MDEAQAWQWLVQLLLALSYCHSKKILHRDVKTQNIFLSENKVRPDFVLCVCARVHACTCVKDSEMLCFAGAFSILVLCAPLRAPSRHLTCDAGRSCLATRHTPTLPPHSPSLTQTHANRTHTHTHTHSHTHTYTHTLIQVMLGDFGLAKQLQRTLEMARTPIGTPYYM